jgi:hypothetical protein
MMTCGTPVGSLCQPVPGGGTSRRIRPEYVDQPIPALAPNGDQQDGQASEHHSRDRAEAEHDYPSTEDSTNTYVPGYANRGSE